MKLYIDALLHIGSRWLLCLLFWGSACWFALDHQLENELHELDYILSEALIINDCGDIDEQLDGKYVIINGCSLTGSSISTQTSAYAVNGFIAISVERYINDAFNAVDILYDSPVKVGSVTLSIAALQFALVNDDISMSPLSFSILPDWIYSSPPYFSYVPAPMAGSSKILTNGEIYLQSPNFPSNFEPSYRFRTMRSNSVLNMFGRLRVVKFADDISGLGKFLTSSNPSMIIIEPIPFYSTRFENYLDPDASFENNLDTYYDLALSGDAPLNAPGLAMFSQSAITNKSLTSHKKIISSVKLSFECLGFCIGSLFFMSMLFHEGNRSIISCFSKSTQISPSPTALRRVRRYLESQLQASVNAHHEQNLQLHRQERGQAQHNNNAPLQPSSDIEENNQENNVHASADSNNAHDNSSRDNELENGDNFSVTLGLSTNDSATLVENVITIQNESEFLELETVLWFRRRWFQRLLTPSTCLLALSSNLVIFGCVWSFDCFEFKNNSPLFHHDAANGGDSVDGRELWTLHSHNVYAMYFFVAGLIISAVLLILEAKRTFSAIKSKDMNRRILSSWCSKRRRQHLHNAHVSAHRLNVRKQRKSKLVNIFAIEESVGESSLNLDRFSSSSSECDGVLPHEVVYSPVTNTSCFYGIHQSDKNVAVGDIKSSTKFNSESVPQAHLPYEDDLSAAARVNEIIQKVASAEDLKRVMTYNV